jgi:micrococcal nuclease
MRPEVQYTYKGEVVYVVDGDTIDVVIDLGFRVSIQQRVRLLGVNAPELHSSSMEERVDAIRAREWVFNHLQDKEVVLISHKPISVDKYGRYLAQVWIGDLNVNAELLKLNLVKEYK